MELKMMDYYVHKKLVEDCEYTEKQISVMTEKEQLDAILNYEGIIGYTSDIIDLIERIYDIDLSPFRKK